MLTPNTSTATLIYIYIYIYIYLYIYSYKLAHLLGLVQSLDPSIRSFSTYWDHFKLLGRMFVPHLAVFRHGMKT